MLTKLKNILLALNYTSTTLCLTAQTVHADVLFIGGGYLELCSIAAQNLEDLTKIEITGSRLDITPVEICTLAIDSGFLTPDQRAGAYNNRGVLWFGQGAYVEALDDFDQAIRTQNNFGRAHVNRGFTLMAMQRWGDSIAAFDTGISLEAPEPEKTYYNRGIAQEELGHIREAYNDYLKAAELMPAWEDPKRELSRFTTRKSVQ